MSEPAVSLTSVSKAFGSGARRIQALKGIDIEVKPGRVIGLIGPDGAGKTTLMRLATALLAPDEGRITVLGIDAVVEPLRVQSSIGYMPQRFGLYEDLNVQENLDLYADLQGLSKDERSGCYTELMRMTGLAPFTRRLAGQLSGGMKQKLGLACVLVRPPSLLLLDEPTVGVDPVSRRELWSIVYRQVNEARMTVLLSTAYLDEAERCDEIILLHEGRVLGQGTPDAFSDRLAGRTYRATAEGVSSRHLQGLLAVAPGVLDALIDGDSVRLVTDTSAAPAPGLLAPEVEALQINPVPPRFEDAFVAELKGKRSGERAGRRALHVSIGGEAGKEVIRAHRLERRFGDFYAVKGISFSVRRGEVFGLLGANGAGKSTTFRMLCGLLPASGGELAVAGLDLHRAASSARGRIGYMAQKFSLYSNLTALQNLRFFSSAYGLRGHGQGRRIDWALETFELSPYRDANARDLPLGYKQRLAFAVALMHEPEILFLDEPTSGVDPLARREFWARTNTLAESGVTVLVTTHFMVEADYCDRLVIMAEGEVLAQGTPEEMKARVRSRDNPSPSMEDAFIDLIEQRETAA